jgi:hypothetical protein
MLFAKEYHDAISLVFQFSNSSSNFVEIPATTRGVSPTLYYFSKIRLYPVYRFEHSTGRFGFGLAEKTQVFRVEKILAMTVPWDVSDLSFRAGPGLGRAARTFYSVK